MNKFLVGSEECLVYQAQRHGTKPGISIQFDGHTGPITAVSAHRATGGQVSGRSLVGVAGDVEQGVRVVRLLSAG